MVTWNPVSSVVSMIFGRLRRGRSPRIGGPIRRWHEHLVARVAQRGEGGEHGVLATVGDEHLGGGAVVAAVALGLDGDRLAKPGSPAAGV